MASPLPTIMPSSSFAVRGLACFSSAIPIMIVPPSEFAKDDNAGDKCFRTNVVKSSLRANALPDLYSSLDDSGWPISDNKWPSVHSLGFQGSIFFHPLSEWLGGVEKYGTRK